MSFVAGVLISEITCSMPDRMHTVCNSTYFVRAAAVCSLLKLKIKIMRFGTQG